MKTLLVGHCYVPRIFTPWHRVGVQIFLKKLVQECVDNLLNEKYFEE